MSVARPIEIDHIAPRLHEDYDGQITPVTRGTADEIERNFCTQALAAFTLNFLCGCSISDSVDALVDGGGDGGIDAVYHSANSDTLYCVQSKYISSGSGQPDLGDVSKFVNGIEALLTEDYSQFENNALWAAKLPLIRHLMSSGSIRVKAVLVYSGVTLVEDDRRVLFQRLEQRFSAEDDFLRFEHYNLTSIHDWVVDTENLRSVDEVELTVQWPGWVREPHEMIYGLVPIARLNELSETHGTRLVASNIRRYKGSTEVNAEIVKTVQKEPQNFVYFNNGLTAFCQRLEVPARERANTHEKTVKATGFSIVNGAQTLGALKKAADVGDAPDGYAFMRIISLERCADEREFSGQITRRTNTQNQILAHDYVALDPEQERIATHLDPDGVSYHYKESEDSIPQDDQNFTLREATTAAACLLQESSCDILARILGNRKSLWETESDSETTSRYGQIFKSSLSARVLWRAVQTQRLVIEQVQESARAEPARKAFFENGRWLLLNVVFCKLAPQRGEALYLSEEEKTAVKTAAQEMSEFLWTACRSQGIVTDAAGGGYDFTRGFKSVFCSKEDCRRLRGAVLAGWDQR